MQRMPCPSLFLKMESNMGSMADSVFPIPVGATTKTFFPADIFGIASLWGSVGSVMPFALRASTISGHRVSKGRDGKSGR